MCWNRMIELETVVSMPQPAAKLPLPNVRIEPPTVQPPLEVAVAVLT